jgi:hypothetical protein
MKNVLFLALFLLLTQLTGATSFAIASDVKDINCRVSYMDRDIWSGKSGWKTSGVATNLNECIEAGTKHFGEVFKNGWGTLKQVNYVEYEFSSGDLKYSGSVTKRH